MKPAGPAPGRFRTTVIGALLCLATIIAYFPSLAGAFIWNDSDYVTAPALRSLRGLALIWTQVGVTQQYYPLLHSAFWVQHRLWGDDPLGYHVVTILLHAASAVLFAIVLRRLLDGTPGSRAPGAAHPYPGAEWIAALLFALHPVHVESVAWITEQKNTLSLAFYLAAGLAYLGFDGRRRPALYLLALGLFVLSLLCKTVTATLPAALLGVFWWQRGLVEGRRDVLPLIPFFAAGAAAGLFTSWVERTFVGAQGGALDIPLLSRALVAGRAVLFYGGSLAWPFSLNFIYPRWIIDPADWSQWLFPLGVVALALALWALRGRSRGPLAAFLFFVGSLFPALGIVNLYGARYSWVWDHWQYLPDLGLLALAGIALSAAWQRFPNRSGALGLGLVAALTVFLGALTWSHCGMFHDNETLYLATIRRNPGSWMAHNNLGLAWSKLPGRRDDAIAEYQKALRLMPDIAETHTNLANAWAKDPARIDDAIAEYREALRCDPKYPDAHFYLANLLAQKGDVPGAIDHYTEALRADPTLAEAGTNLGILLCRTGRPEEGLARIDGAIKAQPNYVPAHFSRSMALMQAGRRDEAVAELRRTLELQPDFAPALRLLDSIRSAP